MPKYFISWEADMTQYPKDPKEAAEINTRLGEMTAQWLGQSPKNEWARFLGGTAGYSITVSSWEDVNKMALQFIPYVRFDVRQVNTFEEVQRAFKAMMQ